MMESKIGKGNGMHGGQERPSDQGGMSSSHAPSSEGASLKSTIIITLSNEKEE